MGNCLALPRFIEHIRDLNRWTDEFSNARAFKFEDAGHYVEEDKARELTPLIEEFLNSDTA